MLGVNKKTIVALVATLLILGMLNTAMPVEAEGTTMNVYEGESIQAALDNAGEGSKVVVHAGIYNEKIIVSKQLELHGKGAVLDLDGIVIPPAPNGRGNAGIYVEVGGVTVSGFTIRNVPYYPNPVSPTGLPFAFGIRFYGSYSGGKISNNEIYSDYNGIGITGAFGTSGISNVKVLNNKITAPQAIWAFNAPNVNIKNNVLSSRVNTEYPSFQPVGVVTEGDFSYSGGTIKNNEINSEQNGIHIAAPNTITIKNLEMKNNQIQASGNSITVNSATDITIKNNILQSGLDGITLGASSGLVSCGAITGNEINSNRDGIFLSKADNVEIKNNIVSAEWGAIPIVEGWDIVVKNNVLHAGYCGIGCGFNTPIIAGVSGGEFVGNEIYSNYVGIGIDYLSDATIKENTVYSPFHGIYVSGGSNIAIKSNVLHTNGEWGDGISLGAPFGIVSDSFIEGNEIYSSPQQYGITLNNVENIDARHNTVHSSYQAIAVATGPGIDISGNVLHSSFAGINILGGVSDVLIEKNKIYSDRFGVSATSGLSITVKDNEIYASSDGIRLTNMGMASPIVTENVVYSGRNGILLTWISEAIVKNNEIHIATNGLVQKEGVVLVGSTGSEVTSNAITGDISSGISLRNTFISTGNKIAENSIIGVYKPDDAGITLVPGTTGNIVMHNTITGVHQLILDLGTGNIILP